MKILNTTRFFNIDYCFVSLDIISFAAHTEKIPWNRFYKNVAPKILMALKTFERSFKNHLKISKGSSRNLTNISEKNFPIIYELYNLPESLSNLVLG